MVKVINVIFIIIIVLYLSIIKRKVKMQSHFSPPCGGRNSFGIFSQICFHFHFLLLLFLFQKWFHFHFLLLILIFSEQSNQRCQQTRLTLLFSFQSFSVPIIGSLPNPILNTSQKSQRPALYQSQCFDKILFLAVFTGFDFLAKWPDSAGWWVISQRSRFEPIVRKLRETLRQ